MSIQATPERIAMQSGMSSATRRQREIDASTEKLRQMALKSGLGVGQIKTYEPTASDTLVRLGGKAPPEGTVLDPGTPRTAPSAPVPATLPVPSGAAATTTASAPVPIPHNPQGQVPDSGDVPGGATAITNAPMPTRLPRRGGGAAPMGRDVDAAPLRTAQTIAGTTLSPTQTLEERGGLDAENAATRQGVLARPDVRARDANTNNIGAITDQINADTNAMVDRMTMANQPKDTPVPVNLDGLLGEKVRAMGRTPQYDTVGTRDPNNPDMALQADQVPIPGVLGTHPKTAAPIGWEMRGDTLSPVYDPLSAKGDAKTAQAALDQADGPISDRAPMSEYLIRNADKIAAARQQNQEAMARRKAAADELYNNRLARDAASLKSQRLQQLVDARAAKATNTPVSVFQQDRQAKLERETMQKVEADRLAAAERQAEAGYTQAQLDREARQKEVETVAGGKDAIEREKKKDTRRKEFAQNIDRQIGHIDSDPRMKPIKDPVTGEARLNTTDQFVADQLKRRDQLIQMRDLPLVMDDDDFDALPGGTAFIDPTGKRRQKSGA